MFLPLLVCSLGALSAAQSLPNNESHLRLLLYFNTISSTKYLIPLPQRRLVQWLDAFMYTMLKKKTHTTEIQLTLRWWCEELDFSGSALRAVHVWREAVSPRLPIETQSHSGLIMPLWAVIVTAFSLLLAESRFIAHQPLSCCSKCGGRRH